jgi:hypothetical protein
MMQISNTKNYYMRNTSMFMLALTAVFEIGHIYAGYTAPSIEWYALTGTIVSAYFGLSKFGEIKGV